MHCIICFYITVYLSRMIDLSLLMENELNHSEIMNKNIAVDSETVRLWLVDHSYDRAIENMLKFLVFLLEIRTVHVMHCLISISKVMLVNSIYFKQNNR